MDPTDIAGADKAPNPDGIEGGRVPLGDAGVDLSRPPYRFSIRTRVELADTDMYGVVYYGSYSRLFDRAVAAYRRHLGLPPLGTPEHFPVVRRVSVDHLAPARYGDELAIHVRVARLGETSATLEILVIGGGSPAVDVAHAEIVAVGLDADGQPSSVPVEARAAIGAFEDLR